MQGGVGKFACKQGEKKNCLNINRTQSPDSETELQIKHETKLLVKRLSVILHSQVKIHQGQRPQNTILPLKDGPLVEENILFMYWLSTN